jgi:hydroxymethylpyrimidine pyrophosphatase-like HAD family hydrolase
MRFSAHPLKEELKLFVFDLDGTALGGYQPYVRLPEAFCTLLDDLHANGCRWAMNTTWDPHGQWELVRQSAVKSRPLFYAGEFGRTLAEDGPNDAVPIRDYCDANAERLCDIRRREMMPLIRRVVAKHPFERVHDYGHLFQIVVAPEARESLAADVAAWQGECPGLAVRLSGGSLSVRPAFLNKGMALREAIRRFGLAPEAILTAGDEEADLSMMTPECALYTVCPSQAAERVKTTVLARQGRVGRKPYSDGVIDAFERLEPLKQAPAD